MINSKMINAKNVKQNLPTQCNKTEQISTVYTLTNTIQSKIFNHKEFIKTTRSTNFCGYIFSRFLAIFAKLNTREIFLDVKFAKINTREIFLQLKFAKINTREKSLSGREDKKDITFQNTTYIFPKPNLLQLYHIVCFSF